MEYKIPMRIVVVSPPAGVHFSLEKQWDFGFSYPIYRE